MPNTLRLASSPIDSFVDYFLDTKPYHTKILEVVETYTFTEEMIVSMEERMEKDILIENDPLCKETGFGIDYDDECGYDAIDCCDLFDCFGGYGFIFDNSDMLLNLPVEDFQVESDLELQFENESGSLEDAWLEVEGNFLADTRVQIKNIPSPTQIVLDGDVTSLFNDPINNTLSTTFLIVNVQQFTIESVTNNVVIIDGNHKDFFLSRSEFFVIGEVGLNNKHFFYDTVDFTNGKTEIHLITPLSEVPDGSLDTRTLQIRTDSPNIGIYQSFDVSFNGTDTVVNLFSGQTVTQNPSPSADDYSLGSIQLRTALNSPRLMTVFNTNSQDEEELKILYAEYDASTDRTRIFVAGSLDFFDGVLPSQIRVRTFGYFFEPGFDGGAECTPPKAENIHTRFYELVKIEVSDEYCAPIECPTPP